MQKLLMNWAALLMITFGLAQNPRPHFEPSRLGNDGRGTSKAESLVLHDLSTMWDCSRPNLIPKRTTWWLLREKLCLRKVEGPSGF